MKALHTIKLISTFVFVIFILQFSITFTYAQKDANRQFRITIDSLYNIDDNGNTTVDNNISITNLTTQAYAPSFVFVLEGFTPEKVEAYDETGSLDTKLSKSDGSAYIETYFNKPVAGKNKTKSFTLKFEEDSFAIKSGEVWEILIPKLSDESKFSKESIKLLVPESFGINSYISPNPDDTKKENGKNVYLFNDSESISKGITAGFGESQVFNFSLTYHLENPLRGPSNVQIAIPPDTSIQKVYYNSIVPEPEDTTVDDDGNWLATYNLKPKERIDVNVKGTVQIFASPFQHITTSTTSLNNSLTESIYWQINDPEIVAIAEQLDGPKDIYNFVIKTLDYDYSKVRPDIERLGAKKALQDPSSSICMEFTDLFITLARAKGIPAREINGFAYTENPKLQPLSLVADVLHAWPEYWDMQKKVWVPVDPTWAETSGGVDYFNKLDLRHFAFVIHSSDPQKPYPPGSYKLGENPQKDVFVSFGEPVNTSSVSPEIYVEKQGPIFSRNDLLVSVKNNGPTAIYDLDLEILYDGSLESVNNIKILPPYAIESFKISQLKNIFSNNTPEIITLKANETEVKIPTNKNKVIINLATTVLIISLALGLVIFKLAKR